MNCKEQDLMKFDDFSSALKVENALLSTLPPLNETDGKLPQELMGATENKSAGEVHYLKEFLPHCVDNIKSMW